MWVRAFLFSFLGQMGKRADGTEIIYPLSSPLSSGGGAVLYE
jgi:hypothetical protein